jgi:cell division protein ZapA (FtsZ GTPase activity inhibitor)
MGLCQWYINTTITILDTKYPVNVRNKEMLIRSIGLSVPYRKHCLRYKPNRLILSIGL